MNEIVLVKKVEKRLRQPFEPKVFPLTPTHRKELRKLRDDNIGELRRRLSTIKQMKRQEFTKKYRKEIKREIGEFGEVAKSLNKGWDWTLKEIDKLIDAQKNIEKKLEKEISHLKLERAWSDIAELNFIKEKHKRKFVLDYEVQIANIAKLKFDEKYKDAFDKTEEKIDLLVTMYEEAINFGDLEIVKEVYYKLKEADKFLDMVNKLKV